MFCKERQQWRSLLWYRKYPFDPCITLVGATYFQQITSIKGRCERPRSSASNFAVILKSCDRFSCTEGPQLLGMILPRYGQVIQGLLDEKSLSLFVSCNIDTVALHRGPTAPHPQTSCSLDITVYGPMGLFEEIGEWLQGCEIYLQDPKTCDMDVRYCNPQRLSYTDPESCPKVSQVVLRRLGTMQFQEIDEQPDILDIISGQDDLEEAVAPKMIRASLHK